MVQKYMSCTHVGTPMIQIYRYNVYFPKVKYLFLKRGTRIISRGL